MGNIVVSSPAECKVRSGVRGTKYMVGECGLVFWCCERVETIGLNLVTLEVNSKDVETIHGVKLSVKGITQVKVKTSNAGGAPDLDNIRLAAQHFVGKHQDEVQEALTLTMEGHQRQVLGTLTVEEIYKDREAFASKVMEGVMSDLNGMGFEIVSYVVIDVSDSNGYMDALGATQTAVVKREALEGVARNEAEQRKKVAEYRAQADMVEALNVSKANVEVNARQTEAAIKVNLNMQAEEDSRKLLELKKANNTRDINVAQEAAQAAGDIEKARQNQAVMRERTQQEVEQQVVMLKVTEQKALQAQEEAKGTSLAELVEKKNQAEAVKIAAEGKRAEIEALAAAAANEIEVMATANATSTEKIGMAEAAAIEAKGMAEAKVLKEKNQTYQYMGEAGMATAMIEKMPEIAAAIAKPLEKTEKMVFISQDSATGSKVTNDIIKTIATMPDAIEGLTGMDLKNMIQAAATKGKISM